MLLWVLFGGSAVAAMLTAAAVHYGHRRGLLDKPGRRRSHQAVTPRGGGIAIVAVVALVTAGAAARGSLAPGSALGLLGGLVLVAAVGWWDDHRPLSARLRLAVHLLAAVLLLAGMAPLLGTSTFAPPLVLLAALLVLATAINFCNFMDGINGIAASQALLIGAVLGLGFLRVEQAGWALVAAALVAGCLGFLPFNVPRARIFLGDVGSGALGFLVAALLIAAWRLEVAPLPALALLPSAFLLDAGLTLSQRIATGKRWTEPHREHLYQWLVRSGASHVAISAWYGVWTLGMGLLASWLRLQESTPAWIICVGVYLAGALIWWHCRSHLAARARRRSTR